MYKIIKTNDNTTLGYTEDIIFIKISETSGCYIESKKKDADGIVFENIVYNILGKNNVKDAETIMIININGGKISFQNECKINETENAVCEADTINDSRLTEIENALCEMDKGGTTNG